MGRRRNADQTAKGPGGDLADFEGFCDRQTRRIAQSLGRIRRECDERVADGWMDEVPVEVTTGLLRLTDEW